MRAYTFHLWTKEEEDWLITTWETHRVEDQAAVLGISVSGVAAKRSKLIRAGRVKSAQHRGVGALIPEYKIQEAMSLIQDGHHTRTVANRLGISPKALHKRMKNRGVKIDELRGIFVYSLENIADLLGVSWNRVQLWTKQGLLKETRAPGFKRLIRRARYVTAENLRAFLAKREAWMHWDPGKIGDTYWRETAQEIRAQSTGRWLSLVEIANRYCYSEKTVEGWARRGYLPYTAVGNQYWVWSEDLIGFVPPAERNAA